MVVCAPSYVVTGVRSCPSDGDGVCALSIVLVCVYIARHNGAQHTARLYLSERPSQKSPVVLCPCYTRGALVPNPMARASNSSPAVAERWYESPEVFTGSPVVFVLDANEQTRDTLRSLVEATGLRVQTHSNAEALLNAVAVDGPACIVLGANQAVGDVLAAQRELKLRGVRMPVVFAVASSDVSTAVSAVKAGAVDVIENQHLEQRLVPAVFAALARDLATRACHVVSNDIRLRYDRLTPREREVVHLVIAGRTSSAIAKQLGIHEKTVEIYRSHIKSKMNARNPVDLTQMMHSLGYGGLPEHDS